MLMENFQVGRPVGTGHSRPNDVIRLRKALRETGHGTSPPEPSGTYDASLIRSIECFQRDYGLEPDGVVLPDGPTARMLGLALTAQRRDGDQTQLRGMVNALTNAGLKPQAPPPGDKRPIVFSDDNGNTATPDQLVKIAGRALKQSPDRRPDGAVLASTQAAAAQGATGALPDVAALSPEALAILADFTPIGLGATTLLIGSRLADEWGKAHPEYMARVQSERDAAANSIADRNARQRARRNANGAQRTTDAPSVATIYPGGSEPPKLPNRTEFPAEPPGRSKDDGIEGLPAQPGQPEILKGREVQEARPGIFVFPDLSDVVPQNSIYRSDRGNDNTKQQILDAQIHIQRQHPDWRHLGGGYDLEGKGLDAGTFDIKDLDEVSEKAIKGPGLAFPDKKGRPGDSRPGSRFPDISYQTPDGKLIAINTVDVDSNGQIAQHELDAAESMRRQGIQVYLIKKTHQMKQQ